MSGKFFSIDPDSVIGQRLRGSSGDGRLRFMPFFVLIWTFWLFASPLFAPREFSHWLWPTMASFMIFLALYFSAYYRPSRWLLWNALAIGALGYLLMPYNPGAMCYLVYSCAFLAFYSTPTRAISLMLLVLLPYTAITYTHGTPWPFAVSTVVMGLAVGISNMAFRQNQIKDAQLRLSHDEIRRLAATAERERIGRDLHDLLGHTLSLIALKSELARKLFSRDADAARREVEDVERIAREALAQVRHAVSGIRAAALAGELASARLLLECVGVRFDHAGFDAELPEEHETCLALALREAVTNIQRHAGASQADAKLMLDAGTAQLTVRDNGRGGIAVQGHGLSGMRERVAGLGGTLRIESPQGLGTLLTLRLPIAVNVVIMDASRDGQSTGILRAQR